MVNMTVSDFFVYFTIYCQNLPFFVSFNYLNYQSKRCYSS